MQRFSKGNSNWTKKVTIGEEIGYWTQAARVDEQLAFKKFKGKEIKRVKNERLITK